jgi:hypothetical protein
MTQHGFLIDSGWAVRARIEQGMSLATAELPDDPTALRAFALACQSELKAAETAVQLKALEIEKLRFQIARLRRMQFGRSSERIARQIVQLEFQLEELESGAAEDIARAEAAEPSVPASPHANRPKRKPLPDHLPRQDVVHQPAGDGACACPDCGGRMARLGEDVTEVLDYVPGHFQVIRHVGRSLPAVRATPSRRLRHRRCRHHAVAPHQPRWRTCWWRNIATICRCIVRARSMRGRGWNSIARR